MAVREAAGRPRFSLAAWLAACWLVSAAAGCVPSVRPTIKIGLVGPFEGRYREVGQEVIYAVRLAVRQANEAGGVGGYSVELMAFDDGGDPSQAAGQARKLAADPQVVGAVGNWLEATTVAAAPILAQSGVPFVATTTDADLDPAAFRLWLTSAAYFAAAPASEHCPLPCASLEDLDWLTGRAAGRSPPAGPPLWGLDQFALLAGEAGEGAYVVAPAPLPGDLADPSFAEAYRAISPGVEPRFLAVLAYDAARILFAAVERDARLNGHPSRRGVAAALAQTDYAGLSGRVTFGPAGDWTEVAGWVYQWRQGRLVKPVAPP